MIVAEIDELKDKIKELRSEMIHTATRTGLNSQKTIYISQKLDELIILYQSSHIKNKPYSTL